MTNVTEVKRYIVNLLLFNEKNKYVFLVLGRGVRQLTTMQRVCTLFMFLTEIIIVLVKNLNRMAEKGERSVQN